jgi:hypothetical protein
MERRERLTAQLAPRGPARATIWSPGSHPGRGWTGAVRHLSLSA